MPQPRIAYAILLLVVAVAGIFLVYAAWTDSATFDESAHIPAGYSYLRYLDYRLNPEHPPLVKALSGLPLQFLGLAFPEGSDAWQKDVNGQWAAGGEFFYGSGNDADALVRTARLGPIFLTLLLVLLIYAWAAQLMGKQWALLPAFLFAFSPNILAHGHYVTTDVGAALGAALATYSFLAFLESPSRKRLFFAGISFGIAQLLKFSMVLLIPYFLFLILVFFCARTAADWEETSPELRLRRFGVRAYRYFRSLVLIFLVGYAVVYAAYALFTLRYPLERQLSDTQSILSTFYGGPTPAGVRCAPIRCLAELDIWMSRHAATRPLAEYFLGVLMVLQRSAGGNTAYFLGEVSAKGWHSYFPLVYAAKETLPALLIVLAAFLVSVYGIARKAVSDRLKAFRDYLTTHFSEFAMVSFVSLYWAWSVSGRLNIGFRHIIPTLPFIYILASGAAKRITSASRLAALGLAALIVWHAAEAFVAAPRFLSYYNQLAGGTQNGYRISTDSNYDWGQDLLRLQEFIEAHPEIQKIAVDYFGGGSPRYTLGEKAENWWSARGNPADQDIHWLAVSINTLQGNTHGLAPDLTRKPEDEYRWLTALRQPKTPLAAPEPDYRAGTSIFIYKL